MRLLIQILFVCFISSQCNAQFHQFKKGEIPFCDTMSSEGLIYNPDTNLYKKQLRNADKIISKKIRLSTYKSPLYFSREIIKIIRNAYFDEEENYTRFYFVNKDKSEACEVKVRDNLKNDYKDSYVQPREIRVFKREKTLIKSLPLNVSNFITDNNISLGMSLNTFFTIKDSSIFKSDTLNRKITYYYGMQIFCKKEADWFFGASYYGAGNPSYSCYYIFDLKTKRLIEYGIKM